ncbi:beta-L-arabinofuranosidase domain-containing protein [Alteribacter natronophilus]|uniref:beta-L-arabinofuranosidase domain-containing protein n=1 Tax=Alteribacter natronophilus TaxID=2583810 RepID=UPI00110D8452|nr:beta-L-arabinofuranosidase domain-containing protein [Alteribacter natronophilus]TMW72354.1 hypothetical protein FGB90_09115 [Alteribacter natronophilus]
MKKQMKAIYRSIRQQKSLEHIDEFNTESYRMGDEVIVYLSVSDRKSRAYVTAGKGLTHYLAVQEAVSRFNELRPAHFRAESVKLDILQDIREVTKDGKNVNPSSTELSFRSRTDGLMLENDYEAAFLPEEVLSYSMVKDKKVIPSNILKAFEKHGLQDRQKLMTSLLSSKSLKISRIRTKSYFTDGSEVHSLTRGRRKGPAELTADLLYDTIKLTKNHYYKNVINNEGRFIYTYHPEQNETPSKYNILRHSGTLYSMIETYEMMPDPELKQEIDNGLKYLFKRVKDLEINGHQTKVILEKGHFKLGGNALALVALAKYTNVFDDQQYLPLMQSMARWMKESQDETGKFSVHKQNYETGEDTGFVSGYYPGEAILSLVRLYQIDRNEEWLDAAENEAKYLIDIRDNDATIDTITHDHWLLYALNDLYRERPDQKYLNHAFLIADAMIKTQLFDNVNSKDKIGAYASSGNASTPVACRSEGLSATYRLAADHGYTENAAKYREAVEHGIRFQLQLHLKPESVMYFDNQQLCLGAVHQGLNNFELRNDYTQHNISSFIAYHNILMER